MAQSNSIFFGTYQGPLADQTGWSVKIKSYEDYSTVVAEIREFSELTFSIELNSVGAGSISMDCASPFWATTLGDGNSATYLKSREYLFEAYEDGVLRAQWLGTNAEESIVADDGSQACSIYGPGPGQVLNWAKVFAPGYPTELTTVNWPFTDTTPAMERFLYLLNAAKSRGTITWVTPMFTKTQDSGGVNWYDVDHPFTSLTPYAPDMGSDLITELNNATGQDLEKYVGMRAEWVMWPNFLLDVRPEIGNHREEQVIFYEAAVYGADRTVVREEMANVVVIRDNYGKMSVAEDKTSIANFNRHEKFEIRGDITQLARRDAIAKNLLAQYKDERASWTITVPYRTDNRWVFRDYHIGDWIGFSRFHPTTTNTVEPFRVCAISIQVAGDAEPVVELTLETLLDARLKKLQQQLTTIINNNWTNPGIVQPVVPPAPGTPVVWDPGIGYTPMPGGGTGGPHVWIQATDPGEAAAVGDFWVETA